MHTIFFSAEIARRDIKYLVQRTRQSLTNRNNTQLATDKLSISESSAFSGKTFDNNQAEAETRSELDYSHDNSQVLWKGTETEQLLFSRQELLYPSHFISVFNHVLLYCNQAAKLDHLSLKNNKKKVSLGLQIPK